MDIGTHLFASWLVSSEVFRNRRERVLLTLVGVVPDIDGAGLLIDKFNSTTTYYLKYHHYLGHNIFTAIVLATFVYFYSRTQRIAAFFYSLLIFHLHILFDVIGSRGPDGYQWPIYYLYPLNESFTLAWSGQWEFNAWPNQFILMICFSMCIYSVHVRNRTILELFGKRIDNAAIQMYNRLFRNRA